MFGQGLANRIKAFLRTASRGGRIRTGNQVLAALPGAINGVTTFLKVG
jgi:hypothetical protein